MNPYDPDDGVIISRELRVDMNPQVIGGKSRHSWTLKEFKLRLAKVAAKHQITQVVDSRNKAAAEARWRSRRHDPEGNA